MSTASEQPVPLSPTSDSNGAADAQKMSGALAEAFATAESLNPEDRLRLIAGIWASLPAWHTAAPNLHERSELQQCIDEYDADLVDAFPWVRVQQLLAGRAKPPSKIYSAPRRFDLATIFVVTFAYSLLFGLMKAMQMPGEASLIIAIFISCVAAGQAFLFGGQRPRTASIIVGALIYVVSMAFFWFASGPRMYPTGLLVIMICYTIIGGAILGYIAGVLVGGVFLVADKLRARLKKRSVESVD